MVRTMAMCSLAHDPFFLTYILIIIIIINLAGAAIAQLPDFLYHFCIVESGNYTNTSAYGTNLNTLLSSLSSNIDQYGFYSSSQGQGPDTVNAIALCRGDVELQICRNCVDNATIRLTQLCPNYMEAVGWYDGCMLRYSNRSMFGTRSDRPAFFMCSTENVSVPAEFRPVLRSMLDGLRAKAMFGGPLRKFDAGDASYSNDSFTRGSVVDKMYGLVQCTPDLTEEQCSDCLDDCMLDILTCTGRRGGRFITPSCNIRFELYLFYNTSAIAELPPPQSSPPPPQSSPPPPSPPPFSPGKENNKTRTIIIVVVSIVGSLILFVCICIFLIKRKPKQEFHEEKEEIQFLGLDGGGFSENYSHENLGGEKKMKSQDFPSIQLDFILTATHHFSQDNKLGEGGFGPVYKGTLADGKEIAVKRLSTASGQGLEEFKNEVTLIAKLQHRNLVRLLGCCLEGRELLLIYEYMPNKSLDVFLFGSTRGSELDWKTRFSIINGIARGIMYLHEDSRLKIIHRDLKASNVLLDEEMNPKISDFGMTRIFGRNQSEVNTNRVVGTYGYMAPEYAMDGLFSVKSDVFSFGVLLLEIVSGKRNGGSYRYEHGQSLLSFAWKLWCEGKGLELMDPLVLESIVAVEVLKCIHIGLLCVQEDPADRPTMSSVVVMLGGETITLAQPKQPAFSVGVVVRAPVHMQENNTNVSSGNEVTLSIISPR